MPQSALFTGIIPLSPPFLPPMASSIKGTAALIDDLIKAERRRPVLPGQRRRGFSQLGAEERQTIAEFGDRSCRSSRAGSDRHRRLQRPGNH